MKATIYKQSYNYHTLNLPINKPKHIRLNKKNILQGFIKIECDDCGGLGYGFLPSGEQDFCVCCKGNGYVYMNTI